MPPTQTRRSKLAHSATPDQLDVYAQNLGFPSAAALRTITQLGAHLQGGGRVTPEWIDRVHEVYPAIPRHILQDYASQVVDLPSLSKVVGVSPESAAAYVDTYRTANIAGAISTKMDSRADNFRSGKLPSLPAGAESKTNNPGKDRWLTIAKQLPATRQQHMDAAPTPVRREMLAQRMERGAQAREQADRTYAAEKHDPRVGRFAQERSLHDDIRNAYKDVETREEVTEELNSDDLTQVTGG